MARRLTALLIVLALAGCAAPPGGGPGSSAPARPTPPEPTEVPTPPPATPPLPAGVTPSTSEVVLRVLAVPDVVGSWPPVPVTVYADGSVVVPAVTRFDGPGVRRLTPAGLERLLARLRASGLFDTPRTIPPVRPAESGFVTYSVELHDAGRVVTVGTINAFPSADGRRLIDLAEGILRQHTPTGPLEPGDWVDGSPELLPYRAERTRLTTETVAYPPGAWDRPPVDVGGIAWPLAGTPLTIGEPLAVAGNPERTIRCAIVTGADEARLRAALGAARTDSLETGALARSWDLAAPTAAGILRLTLRPYLPEEAPACDAAGLPDPPEPQLPPEPGFAEAWAAARLDASKRPALTQVVVEVFPETDVPSRAVPAASVRWPRPTTLGQPSCEVVAFGDADAIVRALEAAGAAETGGSPDDGEYDLAGSAPGSLVRVSVRVVGPDELDPCETIGF